jgi:hypothetical protein
MAPSSLKLKAIALASVLGVPPTAVQDIFTKQPLLLNLSARALVAKCKALKGLLGYSELQLWQVGFSFWKHQVLSISLCCVVRPTGLFGLAMSLHGLFTAGFFLLQLGCV